MTYQKLCNTLTAQLKQYKPQRKGFSIKHLRYLFAHYEVQEVCIKHYCCYGEDKNCWQDVEGINYGWLHFGRKKEEMPQLLFKYVIEHCAYYLEQLYKRKIFLYSSKKSLSYVMPIRDIATFDIYITFKMVEDKS